MDPWSALVFASPLFGFTLNLPALEMPASARPAWNEVDGWVSVGLESDPTPKRGESRADAEDRQGVLDRQRALDGSEEDGSETAAFGASRASEMRSHLSLRPVDLPSVETAPESGEHQLARDLRIRGKWAKFHRGFGIATWASMLVTVIAGSIQYHNLYGFFAGRDDNPCVKGTAVFGQDQCYRVPAFHLSTAMLTTALYGATFAMSYRMPDPIGLDEGDSKYARNLRLHKRLRWVHFGGMLAQVFFGFMVANHENLGLNRSDDYKALRAMATAHQAVGWVTFGALTWAGATMAF
ncbi:MAG: hypothetical protein AAF550_10245 [Myxococcota bacterium]